VVARAVEHDGACSGYLRPVLGGKGVFETHAVAVHQGLEAGGVTLRRKRKDGGKRRKLPVLVGALCLGLAGLSGVGFLWGLTGKAYPALPAGVYGVLFFVCLILLVAGLILGLGRGGKGRKTLGWLLAGLSFVALVLISDGPLGVPLLTLGLPAVLSLYFDVFSGVIQAFVFSLLTMIYISGNCPPPEEAAKPEA
jgi:hypothetical protein